MIEVQAPGSFAFTNDITSYFILHPFNRLPRLSILDRLAESFIFGNPKSSFTVFLALVMFFLTLFSYAIAFPSILYLDVKLRSLPHRASGTI
ncbi:MAG TPA: hypothetical protein V6D28_02990 [Leptolyngbyaceae cyanobacterium]